MLLRSLVAAAVTSLALVLAVIFVPATVLVANTSQNTVVMDLPTVVPTYGPQDADLVVSRVETAGQPDPCQSLRDDLDYLSPGDFMTFQAYQRARAQLDQQLRACEAAAGYGVLTPPPPTPPCSAGKATTFSVYVQNIGYGVTLYPANVSLSIDGVPTATTTVGPLPADGGQNEASIGGIVLAGGTHAFTVTVNADHHVQETNFSNNTYSRNDLTCV